MTVGERWQDDRWQRAALLDVNPWFEEEVRFMRIGIGIPPEGFSTLEQAKAWEEEQFSKLPWIPWGAEARTDTPWHRLTEYTEFLFWKYRLPRSTLLRLAVRQFILTADPGWLAYATRVDAYVEVKVSVEEELVVIIGGLNANITRADWEGLYDVVTAKVGHWKDFLKEQLNHTSYKTSPQFAFHKHLYQRVRRDGRNLAHALVEWADLTGEEKSITDQTFSQTCLRLENLMRPREENSTEP